MSSNIICNLWYLTKLEEIVMGGNKKIEKKKDFTDSNWFLMIILFIVGLLIHFVFEN